MTPRLLTPEEVAELRALADEFAKACEASERGATPDAVSHEAEVGDRFQDAFFAAVPSLLKAAELLPVLESALSRLRSDVRDIFNRTSVRAYDETLCEADAALSAYREALGEGEK